MNTTTSIILNITTEKEEYGEEAEKPWVDENKGWVIFMSTLLVIALIISTYTIYPLLKNTERFGRRGGYYHKNKLIITTTLLIIASFVFGLTFLLLFWLWLYPSVIDYYTWLPTNITTEKIESNPYNCCFKTSCSCDEYNGNINCNNIPKSIDSSGTCGNGYRCCQETSYDCNCRNEQSCSGSGANRQCSSSRTCDTCTDCVRSVSNEKCNFKCYTCYKPKVYVSYPDETGKIQKATDTKKCESNSNKDNKFCKMNYLDPFKPVNSTKPGYFDPHNHNDFQYTELIINKAALGVTILFAILEFGIFSIVIAAIIYKICVFVIEHIGTNDIEMNTQNA